jgi:hypothetical protein
MAGNDRPADDAGEYQKNESYDYNHQRPLADDKFWFLAVGHGQTP